MSRLTLWNILNICNPLYISQSDTISFMFSSDSFYESSCPVFVWYSFNISHPLALNFVHRHSDIFNICALWYIEHICDPSVIRRKIKKNVELLKDTLKFINKIRYSFSFLWGFQSSSSFDLIDGDLGGASIASPLKGRSKFSPLKYWQLISCFTTFLFN